MFPSHPPVEIHDNHVESFTDMLHQENLCYMATNEQREKIVFYKKSTRETDFGKVHLSGLPCAFTFFFIVYDFSRNANNPNS